MGGLVRRLFGFLLHGISQAQAGNFGLLMNVCRSNFSLDDMQESLLEVMLRNARARPDIFTGGKLFGADLGFRLAFLSRQLGQPLRLRSLLRGLAHILILSFVNGA